MPSTEPLFPCYKLPLDVQEHIVRSMDTYEIMQCSLVSPRFRVAASLAKPKLGFLSMFKKQIDRFRDFMPKREIPYVKKADEVLRESCENEPTIQFKDDDQPDYFINFFWREQKNQMDAILEGWEFTKISEDLWMTVVGCNIVIYNSSAIHSELDDYQFIFDIIFQVFTVDCFNLGGKNLVDCVLPKKHKFPLALRYRNLVQYFRLVQTIESYTCAALNSDELSLLLDNLKVSRINLCWNVEPGTKYTGTLKTKRMTLSRATWLTIDHILTMECEEFAGSGPSWTAPELISIVRKWREGGFEKQKRIEMGSIYRNWETILDRIEGTVVSAYKKKIHRSDGKKAVVSVDNLQFLLKVLD